MGRKGGREGKGHSNPLKKVWLRACRRHSLPAYNVLTYRLGVKATNSKAKARGVKAKAKALTS